MQASVVEYCRSVLNRPNAHSSEFKEDLVEDVDDANMCMRQGEMGGTIIFGLRETILREGSIARKY